MDKLVKNHKFNVQRITDTIYPSDVIEQIEYFLKFVRLLINIQNQMRGNLGEKTIKETYDKIENMLKDYSDLHVRLTDVIYKYKQRREFGKSRWHRQIQKLFIQNRIKILNFMDFAHELGQEPKLSHPGRDTATY